MSAESPRKSSRQGAFVVAPQPVSDRSIIDSVTGFISEVVPQSYTSLPASDNRETIAWARFEYADINDPALYPDTVDNHSDSAPILLVLGYGNGVQVWAIPSSGEATEVLSWRQGVVRTLRILPTPKGSESVDLYIRKRPLVALCDSQGPGPQFCSLSFISLKDGDQVKNIKFKNPVSDVLANRRSVVVTFPERIAVFDAATLEDRLTVTTCYPCRSLNPNPVALGTRWLAYAERRLIPSKRSSGGTEGEGVQSYTATVLHAAKSLGKGLRELGESVASSLTAGTSLQKTPGSAISNIQNVVGGLTDAIQPGVISIIDAQGTPTVANDSDNGSNSDQIVAHFIAHSEPIVALAFDPSGMLLLTADKHGHDFHVFRIQPHPCGSSLAAVHHLYILHRGDTTAKVQDIAFAADSRWVAVSTLRGTTHVFPITPYGGPVGMRTHSTPHVVNRLSRFHRSAGLTGDGRNSPVPTAPPSPATGNVDSTAMPPAMPYTNPRLPPYPHPTVISPLAQIRQPIVHNLLSSSTHSSPNTSQQSYHRNPSSRALGRTMSLSDDTVCGGVPLRVAACFAPPRAWLVGSPTMTRENTAKVYKQSVDSLFVMACHGSLIEYDLAPRHMSNVPKEKICDDTPIELEVFERAQWLLLRPLQCGELTPPLPTTNPLIVLPERPPSPAIDSNPDERWLSQVEIVTHAGPHRRLWMGPQFIFKTYPANSGVPLALLEMEAVEVGMGSGSRPARSNPVNMPLSGGGRPVVPVLIESGSGSYEQSPRLMDVFGGLDSEGSSGPGESQLREDLADAMIESPGIPSKDTGRRTSDGIRSSVLSKRGLNPIEKIVNPLGNVITVTVAPVEEGNTNIYCKNTRSERKKLLGAEEAEERPLTYKTDKEMQELNIILRDKGLEHNSGYNLLQSQLDSNKYNIYQSEGEEVSRKVLVAHAQLSENQKCIKLDEKKGIIKSKEHFKNLEPDNAAGKEHTKVDDKVKRRKKSKVLSKIKENIDSFMAETFQNTPPHSPISELTLPYNDIAKSPYNDIDNGSSCGASSTSVTDSAYHLREKKRHKYKQVRDDEAVGSSHIFPETVTDLQINKSLENKIEKSLENDCIIYDKTHVEEKDVSDINPNWGELHQSKTIVPSKRDFYRFDENMKMDEESLTQKNEKVSNCVDEFSILPPLIHDEHLSKDKLAKSTSNFPILGAPSSEVPTQNKMKSWSGVVGSTVKLNKHYPQRKDLSKSKDSCKEKGIENSDSLHNSNAISTSNEGICINITEDDSQFNSSSPLELVKEIDTVSINKVTSSKISWSDGASSLTDSIVEEYDNNKTKKSVDIVLDESTKKNISYITSDTPDGSDEQIASNNCVIDDSQPESLVTGLNTRKARKMKKKKR